MWKLQLCSKEHQGYEGLLIFLLFLFIVVKSRLRVTLTIVCSGHMQAWLKMYGAR